MQPRSGLVQSADAQIFYLEYPSPHPHAQTLILLHGNGEYHRYFAQQIAAFSARFRLVLMDTRGQGRSGAGRGKLNFSVFAQDLLRLMDALHIPKAHLLGFSDGGNLAIKFALTHPEYIDKLILNAANVEMFSGVKPQVQLPVMAGYGVAAALSRFSKKAARRRDVLGLMVHPYGVTMNDLERLTMPTLIIVGEHDAIREKQTKEMASHIPHCEVEVFRDGDHFVAAKQPSRFNRTVIEFLLGR